MILIYFFRIFIVDYFKTACDINTNFDHLYHLVIVIYTLANSFLSYSDLSLTFRMSVLGTMVLPTRLVLTDTFYHNKLRRKISIGICKVLMNNIAKLKYVKNRKNQKLNLIDSIRNGKSLWSL
jgi:hypothetical protein